MWYFAHAGTLVCVSLQTHLILIQVAVNTAFDYVKQAAKGGEKSAYFTVVLQAYTTQLTIVVM